MARQSNRRAPSSTVIASRQAKADPDFDRMTPQLQALTDNFNADARRILLPLFGAAALVLLIACGNVAALLLVRGLHRQDEYAVRTALGVRRLVLFRQVSVESLLLALLGSALGVGLAIGIVKIFKVIAGPAIPRLDAVTTVWPVLISGLASRSSERSSRDFCRHSGRHGSMPCR